MKIKYSWIPFIPICILSVFLRTYQVMFVNSGMDTQFLSNQTLWVIYTGLVIVLFLFLILFTVTDKATSAFYDIGKNFFAGLFAIITGVLLFYGAGIEFGGIAGGNVSVMGFLEGIFSIIGGIMFIIMGLSSISGKNRTKNAKIMMIFPTVWCCIRLIGTFLSYTTKAVDSMDMTNLIYMSFATLFIFNVSMIYAGIKGSNPVKSAFLYGLPAIVIILAYTSVSVITQIMSADFSPIQLLQGENAAGINNIGTLQFLSLSLFAIFFLIELTSKARKKTDDEIILAEKSSAASPSTAEGVEAEAAAIEKIKDKTILADIDDSIKEELGEVDEVIANIDKESNDPDKADPLSKEFIESYESEFNEYNDDLDKIDRLIKELSSEDK